MNIHINKYCIIVLYHNMGDDSIDQESYRCPDRLHRRLKQQDELSIPGDTYHIYIHSNGYLTNLDTVLSCLI